MRVHNVILVTTGSESTFKLNSAIRTIVNLKKKPILVLGPDGDRFIEACREIEQCELAFDPNYSGGFFSGVKAGLHATHGAAIVTHLDEIPPGFDVALTDFENAIAGDGTALTCDALYPVTQAGFFLVTARGVSVLREAPAATVWPDKTLARIETFR